MDLDRIDAVAFGRSLRGLGLNLLVADVDRARAFHQTVFGWEAFQPTGDFAILRRPDGSAVLQLHADHTYHANPLAGLLPAAGPRGAGAELRLFTDYAAATGADEVPDPYFTRDFDGTLDLIESAARGLLDQLSE